MPSSELPAFEPLDLAWLRRKPGRKWQTVGADVIPSWIADMDFPSPQPVRDALHRFVDTGDLGYPTWKTQSSLRDVFATRMATRYGWNIDAAEVREFTDVKNAVESVLHVSTRTGDGVILFVPTYPSFLHMLERANCRLVPIQMEVVNGCWRIDSDALRTRAREARVLLLANPHNPTGRVFERAELELIADIAEEHDLIVIADEIHAELVHDSARHLPFASLRGNAQRTVTVTSASKAFNLAAVRCAVAHVGHQPTAELLAAAPQHLFGSVSVLGIVATLAAWSDAGDAWLVDVRAQLRRNRDRVAARLALAPQPIRHIPPDASYFAWLDFRGTSLDADPAAMLLEVARIALDSGTTYGPGGQGFARLNFATSADLLDMILDRMLAAVEQEKN